MPAALTPGRPVQYLEINEYVGRLQQYFQETYAEIQVIQRERAEAQGPRGEGRVSAELKKGDIVLVKPRTHCCSRGTFALSGKSVSGSLSG